MPGFSITWFLKGLMHPATTPSHIILLLGLGLLLGQQGKTHLGGKLLFFALSVMFGFMLSHFCADSLRVNIAFVNNELILLTLALITGLLSALKLQLPAIMTPLLLLVSGTILGLDSQPHVIPGLQLNIYAWASGITLAIWGIVALLGLVSLLLKNILQGMILRVLGSWIAASAIFVLTLLLAGR